MNKRKVLEAIVSFVVFLLTIGFIATISVLIYIKSLNVTGSLWKAALIEGVTIIFLAIVCAVVDKFRRRIMIEQPSQKILEATEKISNGDFSVRINIGRRYNQFDNFDKIMDNINNMAKELSKHEVLKTDFVANVSHEIKTPLAVIQSYASALNNQKLSKEKQSEYIEVIKSSTERLANFVTNILKLSKLENQTLTTKREVISLDECLLNNILPLEKVLEQKEITIDADIDDIRMPADSGMLDIVFGNIISNAIKFSSNGGLIKISLKDEGGMVNFSVIDNGIGMDENTGKHIFDKFYQGDTSRATEGNGLGLALVKKVVDIMGGEIFVNSALGKGSTFTIKLKKE